MQLGAAAAATRRAPGAPTAAAPHAGATCAREQHPAAGKAGACDRLGARSGCRAAGASRPIALGARERCGGDVGSRALKAAPVCFMARFYAPLCGPMRMSVRVEGWKRLQRLKLAWQARLGPVCVACKFGRVAPPSRVYQLIRVRISLVCSDRRGRTVAHLATKVIVFKA